VVSGTLHDILIGGLHRLSDAKKKFCRFDIVTYGSHNMSLAFMIMMVFGWAARIEAQTNPPPVHVTIFTHIEDNTPSGDLSLPQARLQYVRLRSSLLEMGRLAKRHAITWVFQPDWKVLLAALRYEDSVTVLSTSGKNLLRYLKEDLGVPIDPHSHEQQGYNYTDVAHLLDSLGVGGSTVIGGHIWDASLPSFQKWDRFRVPVRGTTFPWALWRGDILMGSGTPNHVNDPVVSGVWRPKDRTNYFTDDPGGNIRCIGQYSRGVAGIGELIALYRSRTVPPTCMLTAALHILPAQITAPGGLQSIEDSIIAPLAAMRDAGDIVVTDFTSLIEEWESRFNENACVFFPTSTASPSQSVVQDLRMTVIPNPCRTFPMLKITGRISEEALLRVFDNTGRRVHEMWLDASVVPERVFPLSAFVPGVYCVEILSRRGTVSSRFVVMPQY
jgi:hypothetical protein